MDREDVAMLDDLLPYDWDRDPDGYLTVDLGGLFETVPHESVHDETAIWQNKSHNLQGRPTASISDAVSVRSASSRRSATSIAGRLLGSILSPLPSAARGRNTMNKKAQRCSICKKPYEEDIISLRAHLDRHVHEFRAEGTAPTCDICEVGFASQADLDWHIRSVKKSIPGQCCGLLPGHEQPCRGYPCGFDFKHDGTCTGHHPPYSSVSAWTENDRFRFCQLLRKWEMSQMRKAVREGNTVDHLRSFKSAFSSPSLPDFRRLSVHSRISKFSWRSEPIGHTHEMHELLDRLDRMDLDGVPAQLRRNARRLAGMQREVDGELLKSVSASDIDSALGLLRRGARPGAALCVAVEKEDSDMIEVLLRAGACVEVGMLYKTVSAGQAKVAKQLLGHRGHNFVASHGTILLQLAIRLASHDTFLAILDCGVALDQKPPADQLVEYAKIANNDRGSEASAVRYTPYRDLTLEPALYIATCLGHDWALTGLLSAGASPDAEGVEGTALGYAIRYRPAYVATLVSGDEHIRYEGCWGNSDAIELAVTSHAFSVVQTLLDRCGTIDGRSCEHGKRALIAYLKCPNAALLEILLSCQVDFNEAVDDYGDTPLHFAARTNDTLLAELLHAHADYSKLNVLEYTALDEAIRTRNMRAIGLLLDAGAARHTKGFHMLLSAGSSLTDAVEDATIIQKLAACGLDANTLDSYGHTPLYRACQQDRTMAMDALLQAGAKPTCQALHAAIIHLAIPNSRQCIQRLVAAGADLNEMDDGSCPPLKTAALHLRTEVFEQLIDAGAGRDGFSIQDLHELMSRQPRVRVAPLLRSLFAYDFPVMEFLAQDGTSILHRATANGDVQSILALGAADLSTSRSELDTVRHMPSGSQSMSRLPRTVMSASVLEALYFELTDGKFRPGDQLRTGFGLGNGLLI
ncbi:hypothetical protein LTS10_007192 [Elasticomyces elasticus]|nr:hypothetical protein LTS10_007192 [Elasticomyces elasticus]